MSARASVGYAVRGQSHLLDYAIGCEPEHICRFIANLTVDWLASTDFALCFVVTSKQAGVPPRSSRIRSCAGWNDRHAHE
jgi:hypothetical protein